MELGAGEGQAVLKLISYPQGLTEAAKREVTFQENTYKNLVGAKDRVNLHDKVEKSK